MSVDSTAAPTTRAGGPGAPVSGGEPAPDLFVLGKRAAAARRAALGDRASFVRARQLLATGAWRGPRDAAESFVEEDDLAALGGWEAARAPASTCWWAAAHPTRAAPRGHRRRPRSIWRLPFRSGEEPRLAARASRRCAQLVAAGWPIWGVLPTPEGGGEPEGLDTLQLVATCRLALPAMPHVDRRRAGAGPAPGADGAGLRRRRAARPIVSERALRLGDNARNPAMTRKEAAILIRGAGPPPCERLSDLGEE